MDKFWFPDATFIKHLGLISRTNIENMKNLATTLFLALFLSGVALGQNTDTRKLDDFKAINVGEAIELILIPGNKNEAKIVARNIDLDDIETRVSGSTLKIELSGNSYRSIDVEITLTYKELEELSVSSAADVQTNGAIRTEDLEVTVSSAGSASLEVETKSLDISVSSSGVLNIEGVTVMQRVGVSSAGGYKGYDLQCDETYVKATSAGYARVTANKEIDARASSAGSVKYRGNPQKVYVDASSGGSASKSN